MTFPHISRRRSARKVSATQNPVDTGIILKKILKQALENDRIVCGIYPSIKMLERNPENIMVCVLPEVETIDVTVQIEHTLIQAYCREKGIKVLRVDSLKKINAILDNDKNLFKDFSCVLVKKVNGKSDGTSAKDILTYGSSSHVIPIPD
ncbi:hypothetical protein ScPMuIL_006395 [Solemya velum]